MRRAKAGSRLSASYQSKRPGALTLGAAAALIAGCAGKSTYVEGDSGGAGNDGGMNGRGGSAGFGASGGGGGTAGESGGRGGSAGATGGRGGRGGAAGMAGASGGFAGVAGTLIAGNGGFVAGGSGPIGGSGPVAGGGGVAGSGSTAGVAGSGSTAGTAGTTSMDPCNPNPCLNGAICASSSGRFSCACAPGFEGTRCEVNIDECRTMPCLNGGSCVDGVNSYRCDCAAGFEGPDCSVDHDDCSPNPCENGGTCSDRLGGFACACPSGWEGARCETEIAECSDGTVCQHDGICLQSESGYRCVCDRYSGTNCETPKVLLIHDGTPDLVASILRAGAMDVTVTELESQYDANPTPPGDFCAVVHLNGTTYATPMPIAGQQALRSYVLDQGGGFVGTAWNGYEFAGMTRMSELILIPYVSGHEGPQSYALTTAGQSHPVTAGLPSTFGFSAGFSEGRCPSTSTVLATEVGYQDAVCVADVGSGRVVDFNHAGFYGVNVQYQTWEDPNVQRLLIQGVNWACRR